MGTTRKKAIYIPTQPYLISNTLKTTEKELLFNMTSKCHKSKINFKKLYKNNLQCSLGCVQPEYQRHIFTTCLKIPKNYSNTIYEDILETLAKQEQAIQIFNKINLSRKHTQKNHILHVRGDCHDSCTFNLLFGAASALLQQHLQT